MLPQTPASCGAFRSLYDVLGVAPDIDSRGLRQAYRRGALALHPDRRQGTAANAPLPPTPNTAGAVGSSSFSSSSSPSSLSVAGPSTMPRSSGPEQHGPVPPPPPHPQSSASDGAPTAPPLLLPFEVLCEAAQLLMDPVRRRAYDQRLLLDRARSGTGRVSNADTITFRLANSSTNVDKREDDDDEVFEALSDDDDEMEKDCGVAKEAGHSSNTGSAGRWCGLECRCGGYYRLLVPAAYFDEGLRNSCSNINNNSNSGDNASSSWRTRTVHVECDTCSLVIAVEGVPSAVGPATHTTATSSGAPQQQTDAFASFLPLFLGLLKSA